MAWQMYGATPLFFASYKGHVECVHALLDRGAAINQAMVGSTRSMARHRGGCVSGVPCEPDCLHLHVVGCAGMASVGGHWREVMEPMPYFMSWGAS